MGMRSWTMLVRRELWEHRALVWAPLAIAALIVVGALFSTQVTGGITIDVETDEATFFAALSTDPLRQSQLFAVWMGALMIPQLAVGLIVVFFYLLDSLYAERKDRSILFWKSLPISDFATVGSKAFVALVAMPLWIWMLSLIAGLGVFTAVTLRVSGTALDPLAQFHALTWVMLQGTLLIDLVVASLWYAPIAAYLMVASAFAHRAPVLWAVLPPLGVIVAERVVFDTSYVASALGYRLAGFFQEFNPGFRSDGESVDTDRLFSAIGESFEGLNAAPLLASIDLWLGVLAALVLLGVAARLRRWRDDG